MIDNKHNWQARLVFFCTHICTFTISNIKQINHEVTWVLMMLIMHVLERLLLSEIEDAFFQDDELFSRAWFNESVKISAFFSLKKSDLTQSDLIFSSFVQPFEHLSVFMYWVLVHDIFVLLMLIPYQLIIMTFNLSDFISVSFKVFFLVCCFALFLCVALFCFVVVLFFFFFRVNTN